MIPNILRFFFARTVGRAWLLMALMLLGATAVHAQAVSKGFDHTKVGFPLTGLHTNARCESCHVNGVFRGTPRDCASCHVSGMLLAKSNSVKPGNHFATTRSCDSCHTTVSFSNANFDHVGVAPGTCSSCHNGTITSGKPSGHIPTQAACSTCHKTNAWLPATAMDHSGMTTATNCASCHNGTSATGKTASHITTGALYCSACHTTSGWKPSSWNHTQAPVANQCASCHSGANPPAQGPVSNHIPYKAVTATSAANCDSCHKGGFSSWNPGKLHSNIALTSQCASCHLNTSFGLTAKPATTIHTGVTSNCESCHRSTTNWLTATFVHSAANGLGSGTCDTCHNGTTAKGKSTTHVPVTTGPSKCDSCHNSQTSFASPYAMNHSVVMATKCDTCHSGGYLTEGTTGALTKPSNHIPYTSLSGVSIASCASCHTSGYTSWNPGKFHQNISVSTQCSTCHLSSTYGLTSKPTSAIHASVTGNCESCHRSTNSWLTATFVHSPSNSVGSGTCDTCHNGTTALGKGSSHIPVTTGPTKCDSCHSSQTSFIAPYTMNHNVVVATKCDTCHNGGYLSEGATGALAKPTNHIPYASLSGVAIASCATCHTSGYTSWNPGKFHQNVSISSQCATCHLSSAYGLTSKPASATHASVTGNCESCHRSTTSWLSVQYTHSAANAVGTGTCDTCHNGTSALGKSATHVPVTTGPTKCDSCHSSQVAFATSVRMNHTVVTGTKCDTCHNGGYLSEGATGALAKPTNHIPYASLSGVAIASCATCHTSGYTSWYPGQFHKNISINTQCATCHLSAAFGLTAKPGTATHASVTGTCESCHRSTTSWLTVQYTHSAANAVGTGTCDTCHNGTTARGKTPGHIPLAGTPAKCDSCHRSQVSFATALTMSHSGVTTATCKSCHNGNYVSEGTQFGGALGKPTNHIPESSQLLNGATLDCNACHSSTTSWTSERMNHNSTLGNGVGWCKGCHDSSTSYLGTMQKMPLVSHGNSKIPSTTAIKTDCSTSSCHKPLGRMGSSYSKWN